jgi:hypothetical protein
MKLSTKQQQFTGCVALLVLYAESLGYGLTYGDSYRDPRVHGEFGEKESYSAAHSVHKQRLAVDFNLFVDGEYIADGHSEHWYELGLYWEGLCSDARWGGRFSSGDSNHFSFEHNGFK